MFYRKEIKYKFFQLYKRKKKIIFINNIFLILLNINLINSFEYKNNNNVLKLTKDHSFELTQSLNVQRQETMLKMCETLNINNNNLEELYDEQMEHLLVDKKHKFLYCYVPKVCDHFTITFFYY